MLHRELNITERLGKRVMFAYRRNQISVTALSELDWLTSPFRYTVPEWYHLHRM